MLQQELISGLLKDIDRMKKNLKEVKKSIQKEKKIDDDEYVGLKKTVKDLRLQIKDLEDQHELELNKSSEYTALITLRMQTEEELAGLKEKLNKEVIKLPPEQLRFKFESDEGIVNAFLYPRIHLSMNGKEEKI